MMFFGFYSKLDPPAAIGVVLSQITVMISVVNPASYEQRIVSSLAGNVPKPQVKGSECLMSETEHHCLCIHHCGLQFCILSIVIHLVFVYRSVSER